jgi:hypothetical protein
MTETHYVYGNCEMCKAKIEKAVFKKKISTGEWDENTKMLTITYDKSRTNSNAILKKVALAGYDSKEFMAPDEVYNKLPGCCQYDRPNRKMAMKENNTSESKDEHDGHTHNSTTKTDNLTTQHKSELSPVFDAYFELKDALISSNGATANATSATLSQALQRVNMSKLDKEVHIVWMKKMADLNADAKKMSATKDIVKLRSLFSTLSANMYDMMKIEKAESPIYFQHCPMYNNGKGADWLSKESEILNPYYGSQMLNCGSLKETIK